MLIPETQTGEQKATISIIKKRSIKTIAATKIFAFVGAKI
jgi:hypothetical protein